MSERAPRSNERRADFEEFEASELFCPRCRRANPVRRRLLMLLPSGNKYDYLCTVCGDSVGSKTDDDASDFSLLLPG